MFINYLLAVGTAPYIGPENLIHVPLDFEELLVIVHISCQGEHPREVPFPREFVLVVHKYI